MHHVKDFHTREKNYLVSDGFGFSKKIALFLLIAIFNCIFQQCFLQFFPKQIAHRWQNKREKHQQCPGLHSVHLEANIILHNSYILGGNLKVRYKISVCNTMQPSVFDSASPLKSNPQTHPADETNSHS